MIGDAFVFDCVCHVFNFDPKNARSEGGVQFINHLYAFHQVLTPPGEGILNPAEFLHRGGLLQRSLFEIHSPT